MFHTIPITLNRLDTDNIDEQVKNKLKNEQHIPHHKLGMSGLKKHCQHWWTSREQTKKMSNTEPYNTWGMNSRDIDSIGEHVKNKSNKQLTEINLTKKQHIVYK
jgi:hypothetical protein